MPWKFEKIKLSETQDRRRKLSSEQKSEIRDLYSTGGFSLNDLAKRFEVSKKTILLTVNPESKRKNDEYLKKHWKDFQQDKEERSKAAKKTRLYKRELYMRGELN